MSLHTEFRCPKCNSSYYGTAIKNLENDLAEIYVRHCHGTRFVFHGEKWVPTGCNFSWEDSDDWMYEQVVIRRKSEMDPIFSKIRDLYQTEEGQKLKIEVIDDP